MGIIYDIQRCSLHDGSGIRTTVFLKGCPLDCVWCHNPESKQMKPKLSYNKNKCTGCGACGFCGVHTFDEGGHKVNFQHCAACGQCVRACITDALEIIGREKSARQVMDIVLRDQKYMQNSGGGLTVSGGEPLMQPEFTRELLQLAKQNGLHTALETCGYGDVSAVEQWVDLWLYDYKGSSDVYLKYCGVENTLILENLDYLCGRGASVTLRCPVIPGINDNSAGYHEICRKYNIAYEIMGYNGLGKDKAERISGCGIPTL